MNRVKIHDINDDVKSVKNIIDQLNGTTQSHNTKKDEITINSQECKIDLLSENTTKDYCGIEVDYMGNIYFEYGDEYFTLSLDYDTDTGIKLDRIVSPDRYRKQLEEQSHIKRHIKSGKINHSTNTLRGKTGQVLNNMSDEQMDEFMTNNDYSSYDPNFKESNYYWVKYDSDIDSDNEIPDEFFLNQCVNDDTGNDTEGIKISKLLQLYPASHDTIFMNGSLYSKHVLSTCEKQDGYCTQRVTIFTDGYFRCNFIDKIIVSRLINDGGNLSTVKI